MQTNISSLTFTSNRSFLGVALSSKVSQGNEIKEPGERHIFGNIRARSELLGNWEEDVSGLLRAPSCGFGNTLRSPHEKRKLFEDLALWGWVKFIFLAILGSDKD